MTVRRAAVAGSFYPADPTALSDSVDSLLAEASARLTDEIPAAKAYVVPHAGHIYSGAIAALAYARIAHRRNTIRRVVLLGPAHRVPVEGLARPCSSVFETPLGRIPVESPNLPMPQLVADSGAHEWEHSLEVQLPFLQRVLQAFVLVPLAVGRATPEEVAEVVDTLWGGPETIVVVSSDLSHYHPYDEARRLDDATMDRVMALDGPIDHQQACGATPLNGLLVVAKRRGLAPTLLGTCNSGDTAGDKSKVVGYAAVEFTEPPDA